MHRKQILQPFLALFLSLHALAGDGNYAAILIKPDLKKNAHAVMRYDDITIEIKSPTDMIVRKKWVVTVLDSEGDHYAEVVEFYDNIFFKSPSIDGNLYDAWGKRLKSVKKADIQDQSAVSSISLMDDYRIKVFSFGYKNYPYTVEFEIEQHESQTMFLEYWNPLSSFNVGVEQSSFTAIVPENYKLRYKLLNKASEPVTSSSSGKKTFHWQILNQNAIDKIYASPGWNAIAPQVFLGPTEFAMNDFKGDMTDWNAYGKSMYNLVSNRNQLPPQVKQKVHELTDAITDPEQKAIRVYEYMQSTTRYISVQLGIGGWQPFDATYVATNGYGDCKALSNYMLSLLKEVGIKSYYTLVRAGTDVGDLVTDFPKSYFNHVILCVPFQKDSLWLECTSQTEPAGYMGSFTGNRHVLLVTEEGGKLVSTPSYSAAVNRQARNIKATLTEAGDLNMNAVTRYQAIQQDKLHFYIHDWSEEDRLKWLRSKFELGTYDVVKFHFDEYRGKIPVITETVEMVARNYAALSGKRIFISPNILSKNTLKLTDEDERKFDLWLPSGVSELDTVEIKLPEGYEPELMPEDMQIKSKFASYSCKVRMENNKLLLYRNYIREGGTFPASDYIEFMKFLNEVYKSDRNKVVLVKKSA